jgi:hypothetical protein
MVLRSTLGSRAALLLLCATAFACSAGGGPASDPGSGSGPGSVLPLPVGDGIGQPGDGSGQTGSPVAGAAECLETAECKQAAEAVAAELARPSTFVRSFASARCEQVSLIGAPDSRSGPACICDTGDGGSIDVGPAGGDCQVRGRAGNCLWQSFDGCDRHDASSCNAVCSELERRFAADAARSFDAKVAYSDCKDQHCRNVLAIDGRCTPLAAVGSGKSYDCALGGVAILDQYQQEQTLSTAPPAEPWSRPIVYVPGTRGYVQLSVQHEAWGAGDGATFFGASAQFCNVAAANSYSGEVLDPLEGEDDCGVVRRGQWGASLPDFFQVTEAKLTLAAQSYVFEPAPGNSSFFAMYLAPESLTSVAPPYGATYRFSADGGELSAPLDVPVRLPEALSVTSLTSAIRLPPQQALRLSWTGRGKAPLQVTLSIEPTLRDAIDPIEVECLMKDDGEFEIPAAVLAKAGTGLVTARFTREARSVEQSGAQRFLSWGMVEATYHFALGERCQHDDVLAACKRFADHQTESYRACGVNPVPSLESTCPAYLAESCSVCPEYFACRIKELSCTASGLVVSPFCECPASR